MTQVAHRNIEDVEAENARLRAEVAAYRAALREFAAKAWDAYHRVGGVARMAELSALDTSEGADDA
jgi:hypothetical protein